MKTRDRLIAATQELPDREDFTGTVAARLLRGCDMESALAMYEITFTAGSGAGDRRGSPHSAGGKRSPRSRPGLR